MTFDRRTVLTGAIAAPIVVAAASAPARSTPTSIPKWGVFEFTMRGPRDGNPFRDVTLTATFHQGNRTVEVRGFYDGEGVYKVRFMPDAEGDWRFETASSEPSLNRRRGSLRCVAAEAGVRGPVGVRGGHHFGYADGTPFFPFGTTCYAWIHQSRKLQEETLTALAKGPFNKLRMCVFPKSYEYNNNEPDLYPFERDSAGKSDFTRPNPIFFRHLEAQIDALAAIGIQTDLILLHPYDRWGYATMSAEDDDAYLRYLVARLSSRNAIWWSIANEYDFMKAKSMADWHRMFRLVESEDAFGHLRSIHNGSQQYDHGRSWVTHVSYQGSAFDKIGEMIDAFRKPVVFDEVQYEGNLNRRWGNLSGEEMTWRFWRGVIAGAYVTHGETLLEPTGDFDESKTPTLWWAHGGRLRGTSPDRIGFLRRLMEESASGGNTRGGFEAVEKGYYPNAQIFGPDGKTVAAILYFLDYHQPIWHEFPLPQGDFRAELIDPWAMTISTLAQKATGKVKLTLPARPYQAVRFVRL